MSLLPLQQASSVRGAARVGPSGCDSRPVRRSPSAVQVSVVSFPEQTVVYGYSSAVFRSKLLASRVRHNPHNPTRTTKPRARDKKRSAADALALPFTPYSLAPLSVRESYTFVHSPQSAAQAEVDSQ